MRCPGACATLGLCVLLAAGCDRAAAAPSTAVPKAHGSTTSAELEAVDAFLVGSGIDAIDARAIELARAELETRLFGAPGWTVLVPTEIHQAPPDAIVVRREPTGVQAQIGLSRSRAAAALSAFELGTPHVHGPAAWHDTLYAYLTAHVGAHACERRRALFSATCETGDTADVDAALAQLAAEVQLSSPYPDGIPIDREGHLLRAPGVYVLWRGLPATDVPVRAQAPAGHLTRTTTSTDARGHATFALEQGAAWADIEIAIDAEALLGPLAEAWPPTRATLTAREVDARRWGAIMLEPDTELLAELASCLREHGASAPASITEADAEAVLDSKADVRPRAIAELATALSGRIDVLYLVRVDSRFASRMGNRRVWYEASGEIRAHDAWSGRLLASVETTVTAAGVGDDRADRAARSKLAIALADQLSSHEAIGLGSP